jgi:hypothetical protein
LEVQRSINISRRGNMDASGGGRVGGEVGNTEVLGARNLGVQTNIRGHGSDDHDRLVGLVGIVGLPSLVEGGRQRLQFSLCRPELDSSINTAVKGKMSEEMIRNM